MNRLKFEYQGHQVIITENSANIDGESLRRMYQSFDTERRRIEELIDNEDSERFIKDGWDREERRNKMRPTINHPWKVEETNNFCYIVDHTGIIVAKFKNLEHAKTVCELVNEYALKTIKQYAEHLREEETK